MKLLIVNHSEQRCGVYQHGKRIANIISLDERYNSQYVEVDDPSSLIKKVEEFSPTHILYNWHHSTLWWLNSDLISYLNDKLIKQLIFHHENSMPTHFPVSGFVMADMSEKEDSKIFSLPRAIFETNLSCNYNEIVSIGSFGFGFPNKGFDRLCLRVQEEFDHANINIHMTAAFFGDANGELREQVAARCASFIYKPGIKLQIGRDFIDDNGVLKFLSENDINIFMYDDMPGRGLSSVIDYAVSVDRPFAVNSSSMFRHVLEKTPSVNVDNFSISEIINNGPNISKFYQQEWSNNSLRDKMFYILESI